VIGEVAAVLSALKALNEGLATLKESAGHGKSLQGLVGKWGEASEKYNDVERAKAGKMSYKEALAMESAKRQLENFDRQFKDICLIQGQGDLYNSVKARMEESRIAHEKEVLRIKKRRKEIKGYIQVAGTVAFAWVCFMGFVWAFIWVLENSPVE
jgi:histidine ammonia-lyase